MHEARRKVAQVEARAQPFALPFRVLTVVPRKLSGGGGASGQTSGSSALQKNLLTSASGQHSDHHLKATTKRAFVSGVATAVQMDKIRDHLI